ncbi:MAG: glycosyl transferase [Isosphaeraceae bacterium]|jgi:glycosyltransferase involved in cell wall biosynthesis|nr:MAG: glycosyl transferase [Isosphaeraceae bacterium]
MSRAASWILPLYATIVAIWLIRHAVVSWIRRRTPTLDLRSPRWSAPEAPLVTALIPAKDEEATLDGCLESVAAQTYPNLEILVVDDRSTDRTPEIARGFASRDPRVRLITITDLPPGWTGKTHALDRATREARGSWLWYLDADTRHHPDALSLCLEYARREQAALVSLMPELRCETFWEKVVQPLQGIVLMRSFSPLAVNDDRSQAAFANGQFILIRRDAYEAAGGHAAVRDRFVEDIYLARNVKQAGFPIRVALGTAISSTRMYTSLPAIVRGWSRILYDALGRRPWPLVGKMLEPLVFSQSGDIALIAALGLLAVGQVSSFSLWLLGLSLLHQALKTSLLWRMYAWSAPRTAHYAVFYSLAGLISDWISLDAIRACFSGAVTWRGTRYVHPTSPEAPTR